MPATKRPKPLYQRGQYALYRREGRANLEIVWYDAERKRERGVSAGTADVGEAKLALDRRFLAQPCCPTCNRPWETADESPFVAMVIRDYLLLSEGKAGHRAAKTRLGHVIDYLAAKTPTARVSEVDERWIEEFRAWLLAKPVVDRKGEPLRPRSLSAVEGSVLQLSAAINAAPSQEAAFKAIQQKEVSASPVYRADVPMLAKMFNYCLRPDGKTEKVRAVQLAERESLLRFLRMAVATWARPDALFDLTPAQWHAAAGVLDLNPPGRRQTVKHRPKIPVAKQYAPFLTDGTAYLSISVINVPWAKLRERCGLPADRQAGPKLIRRTMATLVRKRIGEANWRQGQMMLGHVKSSVSDIYAIPDPLNLGLALSATESIIDEIERLAPGAFTAPIPQPEGDLEAKNG